MENYKKPTGQSSIKLMHCIAEYSLRYLRCLTGFE